MVGVSMAAIKHAERKTPNGWIEPDNRRPAPISDIKEVLVQFQHSPYVQRMFEQMLLTGKIR
jgi:hypothetical protein